MANILNGLKYTKDHEWIKVEGNKAYIGLDDYASHALGSLVFVELPEVDAEFGAGEAFAVVESVKAAADSYMPVGGKVLEVNEAVVDEPALINNDPYENWMICIEMTNPAELDDLMDAEQYKEFLGKEA